MEFIFKFFKRVMKNAENFFSSLKRGNGHFPVFLETSEPNFTIRLVSWREVPIERWKDLLSFFKKPDRSGWIIKKKNGEILFGYYKSKDFQPGNLIWNLGDFDLYIYNDSGLMKFITLLKKLKNKERGLWLGCHSPSEGSWTLDFSSLDLLEDQEVVFSFFNLISGRIYGGFSSSSSYERVPVYILEFLKSFLESYPVLFLSVRCEKSFFKISLQVTDSREELRIDKDSFFDLKSFKRKIYSLFGISLLEKRIFKNKDKILWDFILNYDGKKQNILGVSGK